MAKTVFITGASSGIGRATAELMLQHDWQVAATSRDPATLSQFASSTAAAVLQLDVTSRESMQAAVLAAVERFSMIDVLVNNAGYGVFGPIEGATSAEIEQQFRTNVLGAIDLIRYVMPIMRAHGSGTIINVSSVGGRIATPFASLYHASKFAIEGFSESFRYEASLHGIRVKLIEPAHFKTDFINRSLVTTSHPAYDAQFTNFMQWVLKEDQTAPPPDAVAKMILRAAEDRSERLRYPVKGAFFLALTTLLHGRALPLFDGRGMTRSPKAR